MIDLTKNSMYRNRYTNNTPFITAASILVTEDCNLACEYCFEKHKKNKMSKEVAIQTINFLFDEARRGRLTQKGNNTEVNITLFGGEPTLAPDIIDIMLSCGLDKQKLYGIPFSANMITNSTSLPDELYNTFEKFINESANLNRGNPRFSVQLSIDGDKETQDKYRITKSGHGSFNLVEKTVPKYKQLFKNYPGNLNVHGCLNKDTVGKLYDNYVFFREQLGINMIWFIPISEEDWDESDVKKYYLNMWKIYDYIKNKILQIPKNAKNYKELVQKEVKYYAPIDRCLRPKGSKPGKPCGAGTSYATVSATGNLYPCHQIYYNDPNNETLMGNIWDRYDNDKRRLFLEYDQGDLSCPPDCTHGSCYRCIASNYMQRNNIFEQTRGNYCKLMKIDEEIQDTLRKELIEMGVLDNNENQQTMNCNNHSGNPACLCDVRGGNDSNNRCGNHTSDISNGCDVVGGGSDECLPTQEISQPRQQVNQSSQCSDKKVNSCCCEDPKNKRANSEEIDNQDLAKAFQFILMKLETIENMLNRNNLQ